MFADGSTILQIDITSATIVAGAIVSSAAAITKLFTGYLLQRDAGWQKALEGMSQNVAHGQADNKELVNVMIRLMSENAQTIMGLVRQSAERSKP